MAPNDYEKVREIGSGSYGKAYLVRHTGPGAEERQFVLKEIDLSKADILQRASAELEAGLLSTLDHPYIVKYGERFMVKQRLCIIMAYCEGGDLCEYITQQHRRRDLIPEPTVLRWLTQMALATDYLHERRVLHRDIKPRNIFLTTRDGSPLPCVQLGDFGISKILPSQEALAHTMIGTPYYLSPEICLRQAYGCKSDMWAVGCVLHELCTFQVPFNSAGRQSLVECIVQGPLPQIPPVYSRELADVGKDLLIRDVQLRPSARALLERPMLRSEVKRLRAEGLLLAKEELPANAAVGAAPAAVAAGGPGMPCGRPPLLAKMPSLGALPAPLPSSRAASPCPSSRSSRPGSRAASPAGLNAAQHICGAGFRPPAPQLGAAQAILRPGRCSTPQLPAALRR